MVFLSLWEKFNQKDVGSVDPINDFSPRAVSSPQTSVLAVILRWSIISRLLAITFHAVFERGQRGFWHLLWTKFSSLHLDLPNWTYKKAVPFSLLSRTEQMEMTPRQPTSWSLQALLQNTFEWYETRCCGQSRGCYGCIPSVFSLMGSELCFALTVLSWSQLFAFISPLIKWKWNYTNYTTTLPLSSFQ